MALFSCNLALVSFSPFLKPRPCCSVMLNTVFQLAAALLFVWDGLNAVQWQLKLLEGFLLTTFHPDIVKLWIKTSGKGEVISQQLVFGQQKTEVRGFFYYKTELLACCCRILHGRLNRKRFDLDNELKCFSIHTL